MQSRSNVAGVTCCAVETMSSDSDLVDITSVSVHRQMYDRCAANCLSDERADDYVYDDDDDVDYYDDEGSLPAGDNTESCQALLTSAVNQTDVSNIPSSNGIVDTQNLQSADKSAGQVTGKTLLLPFGFPLRSQTEIVSRTMELLDSQVKGVSDESTVNKNSLQHENVECFEHTVKSVCHRRDRDSTVETAEAVETYGKVLLLISVILVVYCVLSG